MDSEYKIKCRFLFILTSMAILDDPIRNFVTVFKLEVSSQEFTGATEHMRNCVPDIKLICGYNFSQANIV